MIDVKRILSGDEHTDEKWVVLEAWYVGSPVIKRRAINTASLVDGSLTLEGEKALLIADVEEYHARWLVVQEALKAL